MLGSLVSAREITREPPREFLQGPVELEAMPTCIVGMRPSDPVSGARNSRDFLAEASARERSPDGRTTRGVAFPTSARHKSPSTHASPRVPLRWMVPMARVRIGTLNSKAASSAFASRASGRPRPSTATCVPFTSTEPGDVVSNGLILHSDKSELVRPVEHLLTAKTIKDSDLDTLGFMEVENLDTLRLFLRPRPSSAIECVFMYVIASNATRLIEVGLSWRLPAMSLNTHLFTRRGNARTFSCDCLWATFGVGGKPLSILVNELKAMLDGRGKATARRKLQSGALLHVPRQRFGGKFCNDEFVLLGDLKDYVEPGDECANGIQELLESERMASGVGRLPGRTAGHASTTATAKSASPTISTSTARCALAIPASCGSSSAEA